MYAAARNKCRRKSLRSPSAPDVRNSEPLPTHAVLMAHPVPIVGKEDIHRILEGVGNSKSRSTGSSAGEHPLHAHTLNPPIWKESVMADRNTQKKQESNQNDQQNATSQLCDAPNAALDVAMRMNSFHRANVESFSQAFTLSAQGMMAAQEEMLKFFAARMNKDMEMAQNLMSGNIFGDILNRQSEYVREIMKDYSDGTQKLMERGLQVAKESASPLEERSHEATEEVKSETKRVAAE
jgi:hypothetical protein